MDCSIIAPAKLKYCLDRDLPFKEALYVTSEMFWKIKCSKKDFQAKISAYHVFFSLKNKKKEI